MWVRKTKDYLLGAILGIPISVVMVCDLLANDKITGMSWVAISCTFLFSVLAVVLLDWYCGRSKY